MDFFCVISYKLYAVNCLHKNTLFVFKNSFFFHLIRYNTHTPWKPTSTIQANGDHHHFFIQIPIQSLAIFWSILLTNSCSGCSKLIWLLSLNILFCNFFLRLPAVVLSNPCQSYIAFFLNVRCSRLPRSSFLQLFLSIIICVIYFCWAHLCWNGVHF